MSSPSSPLRSPFAFLIEEPHIYSDGEAPTLSPIDVGFLNAALEEAQKAVGWTTPNPPVGAVVVDAAGAIVGRGHTAPVGGPHAEVNALADAGQRADGATVYVSLEPCAHVGRTPPCTSALINARVARVVIATLDPNPRVDGKGVDLLRAANIKVDVCSPGPIRDEADALILPFAQTLAKKRPFTIAKVATTLDGKVAMATGDSRWVTGALARSWVHLLRSRIDVVVVGSGTVAHDHPALTVRDLPNDEAVRRHPRRVVIDGALKTAPTEPVYATHALDVRPALAVHTSAASSAAQAAFDDAEVERACLGADQVDLRSTWRLLADHGATSVLVEPGPSLFSALLQQQLVDEVWWFTAPKLVGGDAISAVGPLGFDRMSEALALDSVVYSCGDDRLTIGRLAAKADS